ncbi:MAG TPA: Dabb family protein [Candidatus Caccoplasma merdavium]|nr:Dabb family protein [Candidatus Caccoplasma merdavium]
MIKHIVLFKLKNDIEPSQKEVLKQDFKRALEALSGKIDCLRSIEVGLNDNPEESFDIALTTTFDTFDDLRHYANHPAHLAAAAIIKEAKEARACVDYIF